MRFSNLALAAAHAAIIAGCFSQPAFSSDKPEAAPTAAPCPEGPPKDAKCYRGRDSAGAHYLIAMPANWNKVLVMHAHGGPVLGDPPISRADEDAKRWAVIPKAGYAYAASVFHQGGSAVRSAGEDTERLRQIFVQHIAQPRRTILHGQSWGATVAVKLAEKLSAPGSKPPVYDGLLLTSGVLAGGAASYAFRLDLLVVYQYLCNNHPKPDEKQYPLWMGLPADSKLTRQELEARVTECLGKAGSRTPEQARKVKTIVDVVQIKETSIAAHLIWTTWNFQDIARRTGGKNPFGNTDVAYKGSDDDAALNKGVLRYAADPEAMRILAEDSDPTGRIGVPVLTVHGIGDPTAFVEMESSFRRTMEQAGTSQNLVQVFSEIPEHSYLSDPIYPAALAGLVYWVDHGQKPSPIAFAAGCTALEGTYGASCHISPGYKPAPLSSRVAPRPGV